VRKDLLKDKLLDIIDSIEIIESRIVEIKEPDDFVSSKSGLEKLDSISMRLQVIGEIVSRINKHFPQLLDNYKSVVWKDIIGLRNIISHEYSSIDHTIIYSVCKDYLPKLKEIILIIIDSLKDKKYDHNI
jgi:uncharacterized protein with HEPN domain